MRLFVSISLCEAMKKNVMYHKNILKNASVGGRYQSSENYHITLAFIGEYDDLDKVIAALKKVRFESVEITAGGLSSFGSTYFVRVTSENGVLDRLADAVRDELNREGIPFDKKNFKGHVTVGRDVRCDLVPTVTRKSKMKINSFSLMSSEFIGGKRVYKSLFTVGSEK